MRNSDKSSAGDPELAAIIASDPDLASGLAIEPKHTPTPWRWVGEGILAGSNDDEINVSLLYDEPDAAYIVRAVNAHERLRDALHRASVVLASYAGAERNGERASDMLREAEHMRATLEETK